MSSSLGEAWEAAPSDPDSHSDLDYELESLTVIKLEERIGGKYMILPGDEDKLENEEFIVAGPGSMCQLDECR